VPITDIAPNEVRLAWMSARHDPLAVETVICSRCWSAAHWSLPWRSR
jgi:hypothetical protein